jgi:hypothetical protein
MVKKKAKKEIPLWFVIFISAVIMITYWAGFYEAENIYKQSSLPSMQDCLEACGILRNSKVFYHSYTKALNQRQDYYIECSGHNLINITPIGSPIFLDNFTGGLCL